MELYVYLALFSPLAGSLFAALFGAREKTLWTGVVTSGFLFLSFLSSTLLLFEVMNGVTFNVRLMTWMETGDLYIPFGFVVDHVSISMMMLVTTVSTIVHIHSIGYMDHDKGFNRYFSYLSLFVFSMMILVMSDNFAGLFIGWEGVGLCSWLLIGFWYHKESATWAANEAFIMNRIADLAMLIGIFLIYWNFGTLQYDLVFAEVPFVEHGILITIGIFLFVGAMGKSAQFPFHTWLADAMEGPTPVSALIHAATMVTAGVFLIIRANPLYSEIPSVGEFVASLGAFVAIFAATMAIFNTDLKRIIAYSTLSQLGYMFVAAGLGAYWIALFHLMAHGFFKSLLFLGAGNVMHAMNDELNIFKMGGLGKVMKWTNVMMIIGGAALSGLWPFAGFFSKDKIIEAAISSHHYIIWAVTWLAAGITAYYTFRLIVLVFFSNERYKALGFHPHEAYKFVLWAMAPLAVLSFVFGWFEHDFVHFITAELPDYALHIHDIEIYLIIANLSMAIGGIIIPFILFRNGPLKKKGDDCFIYNLLINQYYIPKFYDEFFVKPYTELSKVAWKSIDVKIVDATVDFIAGTVYKTGEVTHSMQDGNLSTMLRWMVFGLVALLLLAVTYAIAVVLIAG